MAKHESFNYKSIAELRAKIANLGLSIPLDEDLSVLKTPVSIGELQSPNSMAVLPMEGFDGNPNGSPSELTARRYERFAQGGAGLLWYEATAVVPEGRAVSRQLWLHENNWQQFSWLLEQARKAWESANATDSSPFPVTVLQLTHSGRYSKPNDKSAPIIAFRNPILDPLHKLAPDYPIITDGELESLEDRYVAAARLAWQAGFQAVDIKATHGYLCAELLAAHTRPGVYGGDFEGRTRFLLNVVSKVREAIPELLLAVRLGAADGLTYPYSWGMDRSIAGKEDPEEPVRLVRLLYEKGVRLLSVSAGIGHHKPYWMRPYDRPDPNIQLPDEHPLEGVARLFRLSGTIQKAVPEMVVVDAGYSWLREYFPNAAAANLRRGWTKLVGLGRLSFAYPNFARDLLEKGRLDPGQVCVTCGKCTQLMRCNSMAGCVIRDSSVYLPLYRQHCQQTRKGQRG